MRFNPTVLAAIRELGYTTVGWNVGAKDFIPTPKDGKYDAAQAEAMAEVAPDVIAERVMKQIQNGSIILLHDNPVTAKALPAVIRKLKSEGFEFKTTAEMLAHLPHPVTLVANPPANPGAKLAQKP
jgi:peptidoglycan/xylan/chitin deacetylase (PgdA/CDA1 family)